MGQDTFSDLNREKTVGEYGINREHPHEERRFGDWLCSCFRINRDTWPQCRCCRRKKVFVLKKVPQAYTLDTGCDQERYERIHFILLVDTLSDKYPISRP
jgi:hypothetical protein